ncbi:MAG: phosphotransferase [Alphaproteobacteria bacterium]|nr:phosphotransferase [Alphaproteobacteria bacterium]
MEPSEITDRLAAVSDIIARILSPEHKEQEFKADILGRSQNVTTAKITLSGQQAVARIFTLDVAGQAAFGRERRALELLAGGQIPKLLFVAEAERLILTSFIDGVSLANSLNPDNLIQMSEFLGQWFGRLSNHAPAEEAGGTWAEYIAKYPAGFAQDVLAQQAEILQKTPLKRLMLAHNDNALGNFILGKDKRLYAIDFEDCQMKPEGWDLIMATRAIFRRFPDDLPMIASSVLRGYRLGAKNCGLSDDFEAIISALVLANLLDRA